MAVAALLALGFASCYSWIGRYPDSLKTSGKSPFVDGWGRHFWYLDVAALNVDRREEYAENLFKCAPVAADVTQRKDLHVRNRGGQPRPVELADARADAGALVFRLGWISDVHIRQPAVKLFSDQVSRALDAVVDSFERNGYQEAFENAVYAATVSAFNQLDKTEDKPRLIINTGDATDAGTIEEAYDFAAVSYHWRYPMLYAIGNHDDAVFGNYKLRIAYTREAGPTFYPVAAKERFLMSFNRVRSIAGFTEALVPVPSHFPQQEFDARWGALDLTRENDPGAEDLKPKVEQNCGKAPGGCKRSSCYGVDLGPLRAGTAAGATRCEDHLGYYSVMVPGGGSSIVQLIALNTTRERDWGQGAAFDQEQHDWLAQELQRPATVRVLFMHHRVSQVPGLLPLLDAAAAKRPLVALTGHDHSYATDWKGRFWEINTGALEEHPQWSSLVEIRRGANDRFYLNTRTLAPHLPLRTTPPDATAFGVPRGLPLDRWNELPNRVKRRLDPWIEARFAECDRIAQTKTVECANGKGRVLEESAQCGFLGALYDHSLRINAGAQSSAAADLQANVVLDISSP